MSAVIGVDRVLQEPSFPERCYQLLASQNMTGSEHYICFEADS